MALPWKLLYGSVAGTSHERRSESCQDYALGRIVFDSDREVLVVACSDGAGSCPHSSLGAKLACMHFVRIVAAALEDELSIKDIDRQKAVSLYERVRGYLSLEATLQ